MKCHGYCLGRRSKTPVGFTNGWATAVDENSKYGIGADVVSFRTDMKLVFEGFIQDAFLVPGRSIATAFLILVGTV
jgi:hypothetical protein